MNVAIYNHGIPFHGHTPHVQPLGGSESGIVYMARAQARLGNEVTVYCNCPEPGIYDGVSYRHYHEFFNDYRSRSWDVLISFRSFDPLLLGRVAPRMIFWTGDAANQPSLANLSHVALQTNIDLIFCVSEWHRRSFIDQFGLPDNKVIATRNGFAPEMIAPALKPRVWTNSAYSSTPFRGLHILLQLFPEIRRRVPAATLDVFSSMRVYGWAPEQDRELYGRIYDAAAQPGVSWHGSVAQPPLLESLSATGFLLYPNIFEETSCIAAIEAQACGAVVITSSLAGLRETVLHGVTGVCIEGDANSTVYQKRFVDALCGLLENPDRCIEMSEAARRRAFERHRWEDIAKEWLVIFETMPVRPVQPRWSGPLSLVQKCHEFMANGNVNAAASVLSRLEAMPFFANEVQALRQQVQSEKPA